MPAPAGSPVRWRAMLALCIGTAAAAWHPVPMPGLRGRAPPGQCCRVRLLCAGTGGHAAEDGDAGAGRLQPKNQQELIEQAKAAQQLQRDADKARAAGGVVKATRKTKRKPLPIDPLTPPPHADSFPPYEQREYFWYELIYESKRSGARVGRIHTPHGVVDTPGYVPVATIAAQKGVDHRLMDSVANQQLMFCNTYHLLLQPGPDVVEAAGGLHKFMGRDMSRPLITDSGGFQVFSLAFGSVADDLNEGNVKGSGSRSHAPTVLDVKEEGVSFRSYRDGQRITLTPESTVQHQKKLGADIIIPLDELPPYRVSAEKLRESLYLSHRWEARSLREHMRDPRQQAMYAVVHGGVDRALRQESIDYLTSLPFEGYAMGGSFGKLGDELADIVGFMCPQLPPDRPRHLLGIADLPSIQRCVLHGVDTFDSAFPTRNGRHGCLFARPENIKIGNSKWARHHEPVSPYLPYTGAYLHHLFKAKEPLAVVLFTQHNLCFMQDFMRGIRDDILLGKL